MNTTMLTVLRYAALIFLAYEAFSLVFILMDSRSKFAKLSEKTIDAAIGRSKSFYFSRENLTAMMSKYGLMYMMHDYRMEPSSFITIKLMCGAAGAFLGAAIIHSITLGIPFAILFFLLGFFVPDILIKSSNSSDNIKMQNDILGMYATLKIHARAGVYIADTLMECQRVVGHRRLKEALTELNNNILSSRITVEEAVDIFNSRFDNEQIDNLSVIIKQSLRTGRSTEMLADISKQIEDANKARSLSQKDRLKRKIAFIQTLFFSLITVLVLYLVIMQMGSALQDLM